MRLISMVAILFAAAFIGFGCATKQTMTFDEQAYDPATGNLTYSNRTEQTARTGAFTQQDNEMQDIRYSGEAFELVASQAGTVDTTAQVDALEVGMRPIAELIPLAEAIIGPRPAPESDALPGWLQAFRIVINLLQEF